MIVTLKISAWMVSVGLIIVAWLWAFFSIKDYREAMFTFPVATIITAVIGLCHLFYYLGTRG